MTLEGIDVSTYQSTTPPLAGLSFLFARASYGTSLDPRYPMHAANARAAGLVLGAYHYWYPADPAAQVATFLGRAAGADLLAIDLEGTGSSSPTAHAQVADMIARLHSADRLVGLYHSLSGYPELGQDYDWVAYWATTPPPRPWVFWQYHGAPLDRDRFAGDKAALEALAGGAMIDPTKDLPIATAKCAPTTLYADRAGTTGSPFAGTPSIGVYSTPAIGTSVPNMPHGPVAVRVILGTTAATAAIRWVDRAALTFPPVGPTAGDLTAAHDAGYGEAKAAALAAVQGI